MTQEHPITPPPELVRKWATANGISYEDLSTLCQSIATQAARWGADQELEACCQEVQDWYGNGSRLHTARRPKPPSLKELALETLLSMQIQPCVINGINTNADLMAKYDILRRALESLPN